MPMPRKPTDVRTTLWIPRDLHRAAKARAARDGTSIRRVIVDALAAFLGHRPQEVTR